MKVDIEAVKAKLIKSNIDINTVTKVINDLAYEAKAEKLDKASKPKKKKNQTVFVAVDPNGQLCKTEISHGFVVQMDAEKNPVEVVALLQQAAGDFNATPKGLRNPLDVKNVAEACEVLPTKILKASGLSIKFRKDTCYVVSSKVEAEEDVEA